MKAFGKIKKGLFKLPILHLPDYKVDSNYLVILVKHLLMQFFTQMREENLNVDHM